MAQVVKIRKYGGDDAYSWAVFLNGKVIPELTGLNQSQARYYRDQVKAQIDARSKKR